MHIYIIYGHTYTHLNTCTYFTFHHCSPANCSACPVSYHSSKPLIQSFNACVSVGLRHFGKAEGTLEEVQAYLEEAYCGHLSVETSQLSSLEEKEWFADCFEELKRKSFTAEERRQLAKIMLESQVRLRRKGELKS